MLIEIRYNYLEIYFLAFCIIFMRVHLVHNTPPYGLSGLLLVFGIFFILPGRSLATPASTFPHAAHFAFEGFRLLYCTLVFPPGVLTLTLLNVLDFFLPSTIPLRIAGLFKKLLYPMKATFIKHPH